jgi:hypothetical protein
MSALRKTVGRFAFAAIGDGEGKRYFKEGKTHEDKSESEGESAAVVLVADRFSKRKEQKQ